MKLMVLDGNSIINRAYYGIRPLTTRDGLHTHAVFGFLTMLQRFMDGEKPDAVCVTFDRHEPTFRHQADAAYKATRHGMPPELLEQMPVIKEVLAAMSIPCYEMTGYEADDLIGTISRRCEAANWQCVIVTGDRDSLQLITPNTRVKLVTTREDLDMTEEAFAAQYGFVPTHLIDLKALMGDSSDNIPGVAGVGEKTAMALVRQYGSIDALYEKLPDIDAKAGVIAKLTAGEEDARHSYWLATIVTDVPMDFRPEEALCKPFKPELYDVLLRLEFTKLIRKYGLTPSAAPAAPKAEVRDADSEYTVTAVQVTDEASLAQCLREWRKAAYVTVLALPDLSAVGVSCETGENTGLMAELYENRYQGDYDGALRTLFAGDIRKVSHDVKDMMRALLERGVEPEGIIFDTALAAYLLDATAGSYDLQRLFVSYFNEELPAPKHLEKDAFAPLGDCIAASAALCSYTAAIDALYEVLPEKLAEKNMTSLYETIELPLCRVLAGMECAGFRLDSGALRRFGELLEKETQSLEQAIYDMAGERFNINSPKQLGAVLFEKLALPSGKKTKTGFSTNVDVLEKLRYDYPIVEKILTYRQYAKLKSTYADGLLKAVSPDGRVRTSFQMTVTATGRLSSTEPNLQNIPTRTELGSEIRRLFIPAGGCVLADADYSQIELRLLAHMADDKAMQAAFLSGRDFHTVTAAGVFHVTPEEVTHEMRRRAKAVNFGIVYGISAFSLAQDIGVSVAEAKDYMERYFIAYPGVRQYMEDVVAKAREQGYVETLYHRRRDLPELSASNFNTRAFGERVALNMPIQGTAADVMKLAMVRVWRRLRAEGLQARLIMQVHDELIVECPASEQETVCALLQEEMAGAASLSVPLYAQAHGGKNWLEAKE